MKRTMLILLGFAWLVPAGAGAQTDTDAIEVTRSQFETERKAIVAKNMELETGQSEIFWPVYNEYQAEKREVADRRVKLILEYAEKYGTLTEENAIEMLKEMQSIAEDELELQQKFVRKFEKVLPALKVFRFYQIENKLDAVVGYELALTVPLVE